jgi:hypothetical protein
MKTWAPRGTLRMSARMSASPACGQPAEDAAPIDPGAFVPWIAIRSPPRHPEGRCGWCAERATMQQP